MVLGSARLVAQLTRDARMPLVQPIHVLPQVRVPPVELVAQIAVENLVLAAPVRAEVFERRETARVAFRARQFRAAFAIRVDVDVIARIEHFRLFFAKSEDEIVHDDVILDCFRVVVAVAANFADVLSRGVMQTSAIF